MGEDQARTMNDTTPEPYVALVAPHAGSEWLDPGESLPAHNYWARSDIMPKPATERWVSLVLNKNVRLTSGEMLWILFLPGLAAENGWVDHPEAIAASAFVNCRVLAIADHFVVRGATRTWLKIEVDIVIAVGELEQAFPAYPLTDASALASLARRGTFVEYDGWQLAWSAQEDACSWLLVRCRGDEAHVVAGGKSLFDEVVWAGHAVLPRAAWRKICEPLTPLRRTGQNQLP